MSDESDPDAVRIKKPCDECPFRRDTPRGICERKNSHPAQFIGQLHGPFFLPCHKQAGFKDDPVSPELHQCPGAAAMRANAGVHDKVLLPETILRLPADPVTYFATLEEFLAHHLGITERAAAVYLRLFPWEFMLAEELHNARVRVLRVTRVRRVPVP